MTWLFYFIKVLLLFFFYFATAKLGLSLDAVNHFATLVWLPSGLAVAILFLSGFRYWPGIFLGAFFVNMQAGALPLIALGIAIGNTLEAVCGAYILKRLHLHRSFDRLSDVLKLVVMTPLSAFLSATIGVSSLFLGNAVTAAAAIPTWQAWWVGDMISILLITPFILVWLTPFYRSFKVSRIIEVIALVLFTYVIGLIAFYGIWGIDSKNSSTTYIVFLPLLWAALRFGQRGAVTTILGLSIVAIVDTILGLSSFTTGALSGRLLYLQSFIGITAITTLILAAIDTERKNLEQRKDEFIGLASHELKNSLTSIKAFTQVAQNVLAKKQTNKTNSLLKKIDSQTNKLERLINDLLDVSKIQAGKLDFHKKPISLLEVVSDTVETVQTSNTTHAIKLANKLKTNSLIISADKDRLMQVVTNLCSNAIKYSPGKKSITVTVSATKKNAIVSVKDHGIGMTLQQQEKLFQRYYRAHNNHDSSFPGLGIGLFISNEIIKSHKGKMWVESNDGKGSTFYFSLPLEK